MIIAIHPSPGSFSDNWISYCKENNIKFKLVNCYSNNILEQLSDCSGLMWHWSHEDYKANLFSRQLTITLEKLGLQVFPNFNTSWHFNDKVGQKYLLEGIEAPLVNSYVFYTKKEAHIWINSTIFPKVFKLRGGAGSINVELVHSKKHARKLTNIAFGKGFSVINKFTRIKERFIEFNHKRNLNAFKKVITGLGRLFIPTETEKFFNREKGYIYFQDFVPNLNYDTRITVIGNKCFTIRRYCRKNDFRASGSGFKDYNPDLFDKEAIKLAFDITKKLKAQSLAFDFVKDGAQWKVLEISYGFVMGKTHNDCPGYWTDDLKWVNKAENPQNLILSNFINKIKEDTILSSLNLRNPHSFKHIVNAS